MSPRTELWRLVFLEGVKKGEPAYKCGIVADYALEEYDKRFPGGVKISRTQTTSEAPAIEP
jgi:hypothetical protein